jgi:hypothetical protein
MRVLFLACGLLPPFAFSVVSHADAMFVQRVANEREGAEWGACLQTQFNSFMRTHPGDPMDAAKASLDNCEGYEINARLAMIDQEGADASEAAIQKMRTMFLDRVRKQWGVK